MGWKVSTPLLGIEGFDVVDTEQKWALGRIAQGIHETYGAAEFIYLKGVSSTAVGSLVSYDVSFASALHTTELDKPRPIAVAMAAVDATTKYGWYMISGHAIMKKADTVSFAAGAGLAGGSGLAIAVVSGLILNGALVAVVASAKTGVETVRVTINRPHGPSDVS